jgi:uncharacterized membrane protein
MESRVHASKDLDELLARLLSLGTWASCVLIVAGLAWPHATATAGSSGAHLVALGTLLLIVLPVMRVAVMGVWFARNREFTFAAVAATVLLIILISAVLGASTASHAMRSD